MFSDWHCARRPQKAAGWEDDYVLWSRHGLPIKNQRCTVQGGSAVRVASSLELLHGLQVISSDDPSLYANPLTSAHAVRVLQHLSIQGHQLIGAHSSIAVYLQAAAC
jgi:hypothetical protein